MTRINSNIHWQGVTQCQTLKRSGKSFFPHGQELSLERFQDTLAGSSKKLLIALRLLLGYEVYAKIRLGDNPILLPADQTLLNERWRGDNAILLGLSLNRNVKISNYLYQNCIHPTFFVDSVHLIAAKATDIQENVLIVRLWNLNREAIDRAMQGGRINAAALCNGDFAAFSLRPAPERLWILEKLGVLVMLDGKTFAPKQRELF